MNTATKRETKAATRERLMRQIGKGRKLISSAEWNYGIAKTMDRKSFDAQTAEGNMLLMTALDEAEALGVRLPW